MAMDKQDLMTAVKEWVIGRLYSICMPGGYYFGQMTDGNGNFDHEKFHGFALRIHTTVELYMLGRKTLDGTCSDMECTMAHEAKRIFLPQLNQVLYGEIIRLRDDGHLTDAVNIYRKMENVSLKQAYDFVRDLKA